MAVMWTPAVISTALWLDAADSSTLTLDSGSVSQWSDKSGNGRHATRSSTTRPTLSDNTLNGLDEIAFNGSSQYMDITNGMPLSTNMTVFEVFRRSSSGIISMSLGGTVVSSPPYAVQWWTDNVAYSALSTTEFSTHGTASTATGVFITSLLRNDSNVTLWRGGSMVGTAQTAPTLTCASFGYVGRRGSNYHNGRIAEIIVISSALSTDDRQKIEGYLAHKWGLADSIPADHPYKFAAPLANSISGIIRDASGNPCARTVYAVTRPTDGSAPRIMGSARSNASTGAYELAVDTNDELTRVVISEDNIPLLNDLIDRVIPG